MSLLIGELPTFLTLVTFFKIFPSINLYLTSIHHFILNHGVGIYVYWKGEPGVKEEPLGMGGSPGDVSEEPVT